MLGFLFGRGRKVRRLRKRWDRLREKGLRKKGLLKKTSLEKLDQIENNLRILEERRLTAIEHSRIAKEVEINLEEVAALLKLKKEEFQDYARQSQESSVSNYSQKRKQ